MKYFGAISRDVRQRVAPLVGAWIEIIVQRLKPSDTLVAPLVGAWIEITKAVVARISVLVAPLVGAWIEM